MYSIVLMIPVYSLQFCIVYGSRIPYLSSLYFSEYEGFGSSLNRELAQPVSEQILFFWILTLFYMCISSFWLSYEHDQNNILVNFFIDKVTNKYASIVWKFLFFILKYIHGLVLLILVWRGSNNLNHFKNLGCLIFFIIYSASEYIYRKTSNLLVIFMVFFIGGNYYFSITYKDYL